MIAVSSLPKTQINLLFRGGYRPGSRGRNIKKGDNWNLQCINCNKTFPNRVILRKHYHTECKFFDTESDMDTERADTDTKNKENALKIESIDGAVYGDLTESESYLKVQKRNPEANVKFRERTTVAKFQGGSEKEAELVKVTKDKKLYTGDDDQLRNITHSNKNHTTPKSENVEENSGLKRKHAYMFPALMFANEQISKLRRLHEAPKNLYQALSEDILQEKWHSLFDRVPNHNRQFNCSQCNIGFKYKNKLEMHHKYSHCDNDKTNNGVKTNGFKDAVKEAQTMPHSVVNTCEIDEELSPEMAPSNSTDKRAVHACTSCQTKFRHMSRLKRHMKQVHGDQHEELDQKFKCSECDSVYSNKSSLLRHIKDSHDANLTKGVKTDVGKEKTKERTLDQRRSTPKRYASNITAVDVMQYLRANQICLNQMPSPVIQLCPTDVSRERLVSQSNKIKTPSEKLQFSNNPTKFDKPKTPDIVGSIRNVERTSSAHNVDDNDIPLDLSMKTGSGRATGNTAQTTSNETHSPFNMNSIPQSCLDEEKRIIHSYYKDFRAHFAYCTK